MTAIQRLNSIDGRGRAVRALCRTSYVLRLVGDYVGTVTVGAVAVAAVAWMANDVHEFAPALNVTSGVAILLILAAWGSARLIESFAYDAADRIDPGVRDGDDLWDATKAFQANVRDITEGADYDDIRIALQASQVLPALHGLTVQLRNAYAKDGEMEEASALSDTVALLHAAAESLGHRDIGE
ncbi:hypothetical protein ACFW2D_17950 [Streptomyces sp. NPDC058914]|uniref:hypothetical protein n=1 Tax=Streptomyces sp. NPDC058914 TaxID=3346671 RepID=UPI00369B58D7